MNFRGILEVESLGLGHGLEVGSEGQEAIKDTGWLFWPEPVGGLLLTD